MIEQRRRSPTPAAAFAKTFPAVESAEAEVKESTHAATVSVRAWDQTQPPVVECGNPKCHGGGVDMADVVRRMVFGRQTEHVSGVVMCPGSEEPPRYGRPGRWCVRMFRVAARVTYKLTRLDEVG